jgi:hypothetical protein
LEKAGAKNGNQLIERNAVPSWKRNADLIIKRI